MASIIWHALKTSTKTISKILPRCQNIFRNKYEGSSSHFFYFEQIIWADTILSIFHSIHFSSVTMQIAVPWNAEKLRQDIFKNSCKTCHEVGLLTESTHGGMEIWTCWWDLLNEMTTGKSSFVTDIKAVRQGG